jgi:Tol biopolymer transport system component
MAHRSYLSPDGKWVLLAEMDDPGWLPCRVVPFDASSKGRTVGPLNGRCTSGAWTRDGRWTYLTVDVGDGFHIWRQRFPDGEPEQVTSGATEEDGIAMAPDGRTFVTSVGTVQSSIWMRDERRERQVSDVGYASFGAAGAPRSCFSTDGHRLYYRVRQEGAREFEDGELWVADLESKGTERLFSGVRMGNFDLSNDGTRAVYTVRGPDGASRLWLASLQRRFSPRRLSSTGPGEFRPVFAPSGEVFFEAREPGGRALFRVKEDGTGRERIRPDLTDVVLASVSPDGEWVAVRDLRPSAEEDGVLPSDAYPVRGGTPVRICLGCRRTKWSPDGRYFYVSFIGMGHSPFGKTYALPIPTGRSLPVLPASGVKSEEEAAALAGVTVIEHGHISPGRDPSVYAYMKVTAQRNLYRIPIP